MSKEAFILGVSNRSFEKYVIGHSKKSAGIRRLYPNLVRALFVNGLSIGLLVFQITTQGWEKIQV